MGRAWGSDHCEGCGESILARSGVWSLAKKFWGPVRGPGEAELRRLKTLEVKIQREGGLKSTSGFLAKETGRSRVHSVQVEGGKEKGLRAGGEESPGFFLIIPHSASPLQQLSQALVKVKVDQSCRPLCDPIDCSLPGSSVHRILQARILEWVAIPFSRVYSRPRNRTRVSCIAGRFFTT